jgi:RNA polymerase sigma-70 factor, ECF subfamily
VKGDTRRLVYLRLSGPGGFEDGTCCSLDFSCPVRAANTGIMSSVSIAGIEDDFVTHLRAGDEQAFRNLLGRYHGSMVGLARTYVRTRDTAEEVVQDTWIAVIEGIAGFEQRSSLKAWIYAILVNKARARGTREGRTIAFSQLALEGADQPAVDPDRFSGEGAWTDPPDAWEELTPERHVAGRELLGHMLEAFEKLSPAQRAVIILRDVEGCNTEDACNILGITETNQRVLLHRGRATLRAHMERLLGSPKRWKDAGHA